MQEAEKKGTVFEVEVVSANRGGVVVEVEGIKGFLPSSQMQNRDKGERNLEEMMGKLVKGKRVTVINSAGGNWAEYAIIPWRQARPMPSDLSDDQVASFFVNPATVLAMVKHVLEVPKGPVQVLPLNW